MRITFKYQIFLQSKNQNEYNLKKFTMQKFLINKVQKLQVLFYLYIYYHPRRYSKSTFFHYLTIQYKLIHQIFFTMKFSRIEAFGHSLLRFFSYFDFYSSEPTLNIKSSQKFKSKIGTLITLSFFFMVILIFFTPVMSYFNQNYIEEISEGFTRRPLATKKSYITGKNFFLAIAFKQAINSNYVDPQNHIQSFVSINFVVATYYNQYSYQTIYEQNCTNYMNQYQNAPQLNSCLRIQDGIAFDLDSLNYAQVLVQLIWSCNNPILCSYTYYSSTATSFQNFFLQYNVDIFFTTRYVDAKNEVKFRWNMFSTQQFYQSTSSVNYIGIGISNFTYYIDDSIIPWKYNKTHQLESYFKNQFVYYTLPQSYLLNNGIYYSLFDDQRYFVAHRYYQKKADFIIAIVGGGIFILYLFFRCVATSYNRYQSQFELTENLYVCRVNDQFTNVRIGTIESLIFMIYKHYNMKKWNWINKFQYFKKLKNYQQIFDSSNSDRDIVNLLKESKNVKLNLQNQYKFPIKFVNYHKQSIKDIVQPWTEQSLQTLTPQQTEKIELVGLTDKQFYLINNLNNQTKDKYLGNQPLYQQVLENKKVDLISKHSKLYEKKKSANFFNLIAKILKYFDVFKVTPSFILEKKQMHGTCFSAFLTFSFIVLSVLTFYISFSYFLQGRTDHIMQIYDTQLNNINIQPTTTQNLNLSICIYAGSILSTLASQFSGQMNLQLVQYDRIGNATTKTFYQFMLVGNYSNSSYLGNYISFNYSKCYKPPDNITLRISGSNTDLTQSYFSVKLGQYCYFSNQSACDRVKPLNKNSTLYILNRYRLVMYMSQNYYNVISKNIQATYFRVNLFPLYGSTNSSVIQRILVDELKILDDDKSIWRDPVKRLSYIAAVSLIKNYDYILPPNNDDITYQLFFNPSGRTNRYTIIKPKFDATFAKIGGIFIFMYALLGILAYFYNNFYQKLYVGTKLFRYKNNSKSNIKGANYSLLKEILYLLLYPFRWRMQNSTALNSLKPLKKIDDQISNIYSLDYVILKIQVFMRHLKALQHDKQMTDILEIYLKSNLNNQVIDERQNSRSSVLNSQTGSSLSISQISSMRSKNGRKSIRGKSIYWGKELDKSNNQLLVINQIQEIQENKASIQKGLIQQQQAQHKIIQQQPQNKEVKVQQDDNNKENAAENLIPQNQSRSVNVFRKKPKAYCSDFAKFVNDFLAYFDIFGIAGELTLDGSVKFGTWIGGCFSIIGIAAIFVILSYYTLLYFNGSKYSITKIDTNMPYLSFNQTFKTGDNFKFALGFVNRTNPGLANVTANITANLPLLRLYLIQSTVNRTNTSYPTYSEQTYNLTSCPSNYLNDQNKFNYQSLDPVNLINMSLAYCLPNNVNLQLSGTPNSTFQKWFTVSVAMSCIGNQSCKTQLTNTQNFFKGNLIRFWISVPMINSFPISYNFIQQNLISYSATSSQYTNATMNMMTITNNDTINFPWDTKLPKFQGYSFAFSSQNPNNVIPFSLTNIYYKNLTFNPSYYQEIYAVNELNIYQIIGMIGGITAFVLFVLRIFAYPFNKFKMYYYIGKRLYYAPKQNDKNNNIEVNDLLLYWYMICYYSFVGRLFYKFAPRFQATMKLIRITKTELNLISYFKLLRLCQQAFGRLLIGSEKQLLKIHLKKIIEQEDTQQVDKDIHISEKSKSDIKNLIQMHQLSPFQSRVLYKMVQKKKFMGSLLKEQGTILQQIWNRQQQIERIRISENINFNKDSQMPNPLTQKYQIEQQFKINNNSYSEIERSPAVMNSFQFEGQNQEPEFNQNKSLMRIKNQNENLTENDQKNYGLPFEMIREDSILPFSSEVLKIQ